MIVTDRLRLEPLNAESAEAVATGARDGKMWHPQFPRQDDADAARMATRHADMRFGCWLIVEKTSGLAIGTIGFFGPPDESGTVMVGYGLIPASRGMGYATEALCALVQDAVRRFVTTEPLVRTKTPASLH